MNGSPERSIPDRKCRARLAVALCHPDGRIREAALEWAARSPAPRPLLDDPSPAVVRAVTRALLPDADRIPHEWLLVRTGADRPRALHVAAERLLRAHLRATVRQPRPTG
ncbi:hypothetical protein ACFU8W_13440 [Streptomyces sp. NPDC057565]|uniref:hypothetical protein n=1 Tax=Streptomyces sp. NPDC057565 TaxID=3346169 RepID=UPI003692EDDA